MGEKSIRRVLIALALSLFLALTTVEAYTLCDIDECNGCNPTDVCALVSYPTHEECECKHACEFYDFDGNGIIDLNEYTFALNDYQNGKITYSAFATVENCYQSDIPDCCIDLNDDGIIDIVDLQIVADYWNQDTFPPEVDLDCNGMVNVIDLQLMANYIGTDINDCPECCYETDEPELEPGECCIDLNNDGIIDILDLQIVADYWNQDVPPAPIQVDLDCSGHISVIDLQIMANYIGIDVTTDCPECCNMQDDIPVDQGDCCIDLNDDGIIDIVDLQIVADYWNQDTFPPEVDLDCNGMVNVIDLQLMANYIGTDINDCPECCYETDEPELEPGECCIDLNNDGIIDILDLQIVADYWNQDVPPAPIQVDLDCSGHISVIDLQIMANYIGIDVTTDCPECCYKDEETDTVKGVSLFSPIGFFVLLLLLSLIALVEIKRRENK